jgi:hypothetical protein
LVFSDKYFKKCCVKCGNEYDNGYKWCKQCQINQLRDNFINWTSKNERIDDFIQKTQLSINRYDVPIFEWIPYSELIYIEEIGDNCLTTAIWKEGLLRYYSDEKKFKRSSYEKVILRFLYDIQNITNEFS